MGLVVGLRDPKWVNNGELSMLYQGDGPERFTCD